MGEFDPVSWETAERAVGAPAAEVTAMVDEMGEAMEGADEPPYEAVKAIHDALDTAERSVPSAGEPFVTAYLLEKEEIIAPEDGEYRSLVDRRPSAERLRELFWDRGRTLWWIGLLAGVHPSLVTYWLYEADIPLMERNYGEESMERIRAVPKGDERGV